MDTKCFTRLTQTIQSIKNDLLSNEQLRRLLVLDNPDNKNVPTPSLQTSAEHIFIQPIVDIDTDGKYNKSIFITINMKECTINTAKNFEKISYNIEVMPMVDKHKYVYADKIRVLELTQIIVNTLNGTKYNLVSPLVFISGAQTLTNDSVVGLDLVFVASDGVASTNE